MSDTLLLGPAPGRRGGRAFAPVPGSAGEHLAHLLGVRDVADVFAVANLLDYWPGRAPGGQGDALHTVALHDAGAAFPRDDWSHIVMVGRAVATMLGASPSVPALTWFPLTKRTRAALLPHPSGLNRWWNTQANREHARAFLQAAARG